MKNNYLFIYDINSVSNNIPIFFKLAISHSRQIAIKENKELTAEINVVLFKDYNRDSLKNSIVLSLSITKEHINHMPNMHFLMKDKLIKTMKIFDLKSNFSPSMYYIIKKEY